jgi:hypothetical protein
MPIWLGGVIEIGPISVKVAVVDDVTVNVNVAVSPLLEALPVATMSAEPFSVMTVGLPGVTWPVPVSTLPVMLLMVKPAAAVLRMANAPVSVTLFPLTVTVRTIDASWLGVRFELTNELPVS